MGKAKYDEAGATAGTSPGGSNAYVPGTGKRRFEDDDEYEHRRAALFDEHGPDAHSDVDFTPEVLQRVCDASNKRYRDTGDAVPIYDRHTSDDPDEDQPELMGYATGFEVGDIGEEEPRKAIFATLHIRKDQVEKARNLPRRSVEIWQDDVIDPIVMGRDRHPIDSVALLGGTRPARDLGLLAARHGGARTRYERYENTGGPLNPDELVAQCVEALAKSPEFEWIRGQMAKEAEPAANEAEAEEPAQMECDDKAKMAEDEHEDEEKPDQYRHQMDQLRRRYAKLETSNKDLLARFAASERKERVAERRADLLGLEQEGVSFELAEELDLVSDLEPAPYARHIEHMRKRYQRAPVGVRITPANVPADGGRARDQSDPNLVYEAAIRAANEKYHKGRA